MTTAITMRPLINLSLNMRSTLKQNPKAFLLEMAVVSQNLSDPVVEHNVH
ncbi:MAG TPA: hypothetical protein VK612_10605 [Pyrinomonadaceae bacterium]|nr:hypothetical protein [Pyrinomonadaceae bacterium]